MNLISLTIVADGFNNIMTATQVDDEGNLLVNSIKVLILIVIVIALRKFFLTVKKKIKDRINKDI